ncbi:MAG: RHS repeat protein, partial [Acidimicrobiia bacterium]|nr:RHS repeat protein [Acidimicrobiia bacterium]
MAGSGAVTSTSTGGTRGGARTLFALSDKTQSLTPRGNAPGANVQTYVTDYYVDNNAAANPNAVLVTTTCSAPKAPTSNTGNVCETDAPASAGVTPPANRCVESSSTRPTPFACTDYTYDTFGQKLTMTSPKAVVEGGNPFTYTYYADSDLDLSANVSAGGWLKGVQDPTGNFVAYAYDRAGNAVRTWDRNATQGHALASYPGTVAAPTSGGYHETLYGPYAAAPSGSTAYSAPWRFLVSDRDPVGNLTTYTLDANGNRTAIRPPRGTAAGNANYDTTQSFDNNDNIASTLAPAEKAANQPDNTDHPTTYVYDPFNNNTSVTDGRGNVTAHYYDSVHRAPATAWTRGAAGSVNVPSACVASSGSAQAPLPSGRVACRSAVGMDGVDNITGIQDGNHQVEYRIFDGIHREIRRTVPRNDGTYTNTESDTNYDLDGNALDVCSPRQLDSASREPDATGTCTSTSKLATHNAYDAAGRLSTTTTYRSATLAETTQYAYDADGNRVSVTDANNHQTTDTYNLLDRKVTEAVPRDASTTNTTTWNYDPAGNTTAVTKPANRITAYGYDADNRLTDTIVGADNVSVALAGTVDAQGTKNIHTRVLYDPDGNVAASFDPRAFDPAETASAPSPAFMARTDYDPDGRPTASYVPRYDQAATGRHDDLGLNDPSGTDQQTSQCPTNPSPQAVAGVPSYPSTVGVCVTKVSYDAAGNQTKVTLPTATNGSSNRHLDLSYTDDNLLAAVCGPAPGAQNIYPTACATYGNSSRVTVAAYEYDADTNVVRQVDANGNQQLTSYLSDGLVQTETGQPSGTLTHVTQHAYDAGGNETTLTDPAGNHTVTTYYDDNLRRDVTDGASDKTSYAYDGVGNASTVTSPSANAHDANNTAGTPTTNTYTFDNLLLTSIVPVAPDGSQRRRTTYGYDAGGRKTSQNAEMVDPNGTLLPSGEGYTQHFTWFQDD